MKEIFFSKAEGLQPATLQKKEFFYKLFFKYFVILNGTTILRNISQRLLLKMRKLKKINFSLYLRFFLLLNITTDIYFQACAVLILDLL